MTPRWGQCSSTPHHVITCNPFPRRCLASVAPNLLSGRTLPRLEKDIHVYQTPASPSSKEAWKRSVLCALRSAGRGCECHMLRRRTCSPALTCQHFTAKCFPAKCTRALSHSAMVCTGKQATVAAAVRLEYNSGWKRKPAPPCSGRKTQLSTSWGL